MPQKCWQRQIYKSYQDLFERARSGDDRIRKILKQRAVELGTGLAALLAGAASRRRGFSCPDRIEIGGGVSGSGERFLKAVREGYVAAAGISARVSPESIVLSKFKGSFKGEFFGTLRG